SSEQRLILMAPAETWGRESGVRQRRLNGARASRPLRTAGGTPALQENTPPRLLAPAPIPPSRSAGRGVGVEDYADSAGCGGWAGKTFASSRARQSGQMPCVTWTPACSHR